MIAVAGVQRAIPCLDNAWIMVAAGLGARVILLEVSFPFPGAPFVVGNLDSQLVPTPFSIVTNQHPMPVAQRNDFGAGPRVGQVTVGDGRPSLAVVAGLALMQSATRRSVVAHQRIERAVTAT